MQQVQPAENDHGGQASADNPTFTLQQGLQEFYSLDQLNAYKIQLDFAAPISSPPAFAW
jgi:hypothetical protein